MIAKFLNSVVFSMYALGRIKNHIDVGKLPRMAHAIWTSKLRYGLQLCSNIRLKDTDSHNTLMQAAQVAQNKMLRLLDNSTLADRKSTLELLKKSNMLSVNQLAASIKLTEAWKACNIPNYPIELEKNHANLAPTDRVVRPQTTRVWKEDGRTNTARDSFTRSAAKIWNQAPTEIKTAETLSSAKKLIKSYCQMLPI